MNEQEKIWMLQYMLLYIRYKTLYLLSQNKYHAAIFANYVLEDLKDYIHAEQLKQNRNYRSVISFLTSVASMKDTSYGELLKCTRCCVSI